MSNDLVKLTNAIKDHFPTQKVYLFGSYADKSQSDESDIDICIITKDKTKRKLDIIRDIRKLLYSLTDKPLDILVYSEEEFNERADLQCTMEHKIKEDGVVLYG